MFPKLLSMFLATVLLSLPLSSSAETSRRRVCRGAMVPLQLNELKKSVKAQLKSQNISFSSVKVEIARANRPRDTITADFSSNVVLGSGDTPSATFNGVFAPTTSCSFTANLRITVRYPNGTKMITVNPATFYGALLPVRITSADD